jgi:hypothetical protein
LDEGRIGKRARRWPAAIEGVFHQVARDDPAGNGAHLESAAVLCQSEGMAIRLSCLLAAAPLLSVGCSQSDKSNGDGSGDVNATSSSDDDAGDDDAGDDDTSDDDTSDDDTSDDDTSDDDTSDDDAGDDDTSDDDAADGDDGKAPSCAELHNAVGDALASAAQALDKGCTRTADCVVFEQRPSCVDGCGTRFVANAASADLSGAVDELENTTCRDFYDAGCEVVPSPCPADTRVAQCLGGQCQFVGAAATCEAIQDQVQAARDSAVAQVDTSCQKDQDCQELGHQPRCLATCGGSLALGSSDGGALDEAIVTIDDTLCHEFDDAGCLVLPPGCPASEQQYEPRCNEGQCTYVESDPTAVCSEAPEQAEVLHDQLVADADASCEVAGDCAIVESPLTCISGCLPPIAANSADAGRIRDALNAGQEQVCAPFDDAGCDVTTIECPAGPYEAACLDGRCVYAACNGEEVGFTRTECALELDDYQPLEEALDRVVVTLLYEDGTTAELGYGDPDGWSLDPDVAYVLHLEGAACVAVLQGGSVEVAIPCDARVSLVKL